jgi:hypothetical protein
MERQEVQASMPEDSDVSRLDAAGDGREKHSMKLR